MADHSQMAPPLDEGDDAVDERLGLSKWPRRIITVWLLYHLFAIVIAPASVAPASDLSRTAWTYCRPYLQTLYLNHGYHYFAPDPGEATLLAFVVEKEDGTLIRNAIPRGDIWPRQLYHRHFMLTESLALISRVSDAMEPTGETPPGTESNQTDETEDGLSEDSTEESALPSLRGLEKDWLTSYADCLLHKYDGKNVTLTRVVHWLPTIEAMREARENYRTVVYDTTHSKDPAAAKQELARIEALLSLSEPDSFDEFPIGTFTRAGEFTPAPTSPPNRDRDRPEETKPEETQTAEKEEADRE